MNDKPLSGVVALVHFKSDEVISFKQTLFNKLTDLGARVTKRFGRDVTHIIFQARFKPTPEQEQIEKADLRALHDRAAKVHEPV